MELKPYFAAQFLTRLLPVLVLQVQSSHVPENLLEIVDGLGQAVLVDLAVDAPLPPLFAQSADLNKVEQFKLIFNAACKEMLDLCG